MTSWPMIAGPCDWPICTWNVCVGWCGEWYIWFGTINSFRHPLLEVSSNISPWLLYDEHCMGIIIMARRKALVDIGKTMLISVISSQDIACFVTNMYFSVRLDKKVLNTDFLGRQTGTWQIGITIFLPLPTSDLCCKKVNLFLVVQIQISLSIRWMAPPLIFNKKKRHKKLFISWQCNSFFKESISQSVKVLFFFLYLFISNWHLKGKCPTKMF